MKKLLLLCLSLAFVFCFATVHGEDDLLARIQARGYIVVAMEGTWAPWTYHDENDELVGLDVDIAKLIAEGLGVEARFEEPLWDAILSGVDSGRYDIACNGVGYTEERAKSYLFTTPYVYTQKVLVVRADNDVKRPPIRLPAPTLRWQSHTAPRWNPSTTWPIPSCRSCRAGWMPPSTRVYPSKTT